MMRLLRFLLGERISNAIVEEWKIGDKIVALYVGWACVSTAISVLIRLVKAVL
jgi:hypothetical protein